MAAAERKPESPEPRPGDDRREDDHPPADAPPTNPEKDKTVHGDEELVV